MYSLRSNESRSWLPTFRAALRLGLAVLALQLLPQAQQKNAPEDQVKAAYLLNFAKLAEWPRQVFEDDAAPLVIGVSGADEDFLDVLKSLVAGKTAGAHPLLVRLVSTEGEMKLCHVVFFRALEKKHVTDIDGLVRPGLLLVGEAGAFLRQGGMINLVRDHGTIRFEINSETLARAEIHFSAKMLALAKSENGSPVAASVAAAPGAAQATRPIEHQEPPVYPDIAWRLNLAGTVQVEALVRADGTVKEVRILGGHPLLAEAVMRAVMEWKYQPAAKETVEVLKFVFPQH